MANQVLITNITSNRISRRTVIRHEAGERVIKLNFVQIRRLQELLEQAGMSIGEVLGVSQSSLYNGASLVQFELHNLDDQKFSLIALPGNYYKIVAKHSEKVLAVSEGSRGNGASVIQYEWLDMDEQKFKFEEV